MERLPEDTFDPGYHNLNETLIDRESEDLRRAAVADAAARTELQLHNGETFGLRPHQTPAFAAGVSFLQIDRDTPEGHTPSAHFVLPTGYGKSFLIARLAMAAGVGDQSIPEKIRPQAMIFVPSRELKDQTIGDQIAGIRGLAEHAPHLKVLPAEEAFRTGERADIQVATYMWAIRALREKRLSPNQISLFFHDESHHTLGDITNSTIQNLCAGSFNFGLTATPEYSSERTIARLFPKRLARISMVEGILKHKFLSNVQLFTLHSQELIKDVGNRNHDFVEEEVGHLAESDIRNKNVIATALHGLAHTGGKGMIRCIAGNEQAHAQKLAAALKEREHPLKKKPIVAEAVGTFRSNAENTRILETFATTDEIDVLLSVRKGGEGYDVPDLRWGIVAAPTTSYLSLEQFLGRGLRPKEQNNLFVMYQVVDAISDTHNKRLAYVHRLFDLTHPPAQGHIIGTSSRPVPPLPITATGGRGSDTHSDLEGRSSSSDQSEEPVFAVSDHTDFVLLEKTQTIVRREETDISNRYALSRISSGSHIGRNALRAILAETGHEAITTIALGDEEPEHFYSEEALNSVFGDISRKGDMKLTDLSKELGVPLGLLLSEIDDLNIDLPQLYDRFFTATKRQKTPRLEAFVREEHLGHITVHIKQLYAKLQAHEIDIADICEMTGKTAATMTQYFDARDIPYTQRNIHASHNKKSRIYDRATIISWFERHSQAEPFDPNGEFTAIHDVAKQSGLGSRPLLVGATRNQIPISYFTSKNKVLDCVRTRDIPELIAAAKEYRAEVDHRLEEQNRQETRAEIAARLGISQFVVDQAITDLGAQPMHTKHPENGDDLYGGQTRQSILSHVKKRIELDMSIVSSEAALLASLTHTHFTEPEAAVFIAHNEKGDTSPEKTPHEQQEPVKEPLFVASAPEPRIKPKIATRTPNKPQPATQAPATQSISTPESPLTQNAEAARQVQYASRPDQGQGPFLRARTPSEQSQQQLRAPQQRHFNAIAGNIMPGRPLAPTAQAIHQPLGVLLAVMAHDPRFKDSEVGVNHNKQVVTDPHTISVLRNAFMGVRMIPPDWTSLHDIADDHNMRVEDLMAWAQTSGFDENHIRIIRDKGTSRHAFISPQITKQLLESLVTINGGKRRYRT